MQRPKSFYPERPKLADFLQRSTNLKALTVNGSSPSTDFRDLVDFAPLDEAIYASYLGAHTAWVNACDSVDAQQHELALRKRALEQYREVLNIVPVPGAMHEMDRTPIKIPHYPSIIVGVDMERKVPHPPVLSSAPHQAEKRANRKKARDMRVKVKANVAEATAEILALKTVPVIKEQRLAIQKVTEQRPLHKAEEVAARSAATRASLIQKSSPDLVPEVKTDEGWKLVTRRKGDHQKILATTTKMGAAGTQLHHANVMGDPALIRGAGKLLAATTRMPSSTAGR